MTVALIRHGSTGGTLRKVYIGRTDDSLCGEGRRDLLRRKEAGQYPEVQTVFSSPLLRCVESSGLLYPEAAPLILEALRERDFGRFEGLTHREITALPGYGAWGMDAARMEFPEGESWEALSRRAVSGFQSLLKKTAGDAAVICHGGVIMALLEHYTGEPRYSWHCDPGCGYLLAVDALGAVRVTGSVGA